MFIECLKLLRRCRSWAQWAGIAIMERAGSLRLLGGLRENESDGTSLGYWPDHLMEDCVRDRILQLWSFCVLCAGITIGIFLARWLF